MSKRPHDSQAPASASEDLAKRLKTAGNDAVLLHEIIKSNDSAAVAAAFAALLAGGSSEATNDAKRRKKIRNRLSSTTPNETLVEILLFADRDTLDAMQLVCLFLRDFIRDREAKELPLRPISRVQIGKLSRPKRDDDWTEHWLPVVGVARDANTETVLRPDTVHKLVPYLRLAYCKSVCIDLRLARSVRRGLRTAAYGAVFGDLVVPNTFVGVLTVCVDKRSAHIAIRAFETFKPVSKAVVKVDGEHGWASFFDEAFFISAARCGVRCIKFDAGSHSVTGINLLPALSFGFAEAATGGDRRISNVFCELDGDENFLGQLVKKAGELDGRQHIDFKFSIGDLSSPIARAGFEKYQKCGRCWVVDDLENGVSVKVVEDEETTDIHVFSSV